MRVGERRAELRAVDEFLRTAQSSPSVLVIEGEAGIGKTTLWQGAVEHAVERGFRVLSARAEQAQTGTAFCVLADLLADVEAEIVETLPHVQRVALDRVRTDECDAGPATDERIVASAFLVLLDRLAAVTPVLVAIDDLQWLDSSSRSVLAFSARRLKGRVGVIAAERTEGHAVGGAWLQVNATQGVSRVRVAPLSMTGLHTVLTGRLGHGFSRTTMNRIAELSGGNPFYALELARALEGRPATDQSALPGSLADLVESRLVRLPTDALDVLLAASCVGTATVDLLARVTGRTAVEVVESIEEAETDGIVTIEGNRVQFTHPLLARGVHGMADPARRRDMHRALAGIVELPEMRARHLALSSTTADAETLRALDEAAVTARTRGAPSAAAELVELAMGLGGDDDERRIQAAEYHFHAGDTRRAHELLAAVLETLPPGLQRARAANILATIRTYDDSVGDAVTLLTAALPDATGDPRLMASCLLQLAFAHFMENDFTVAFERVEQAAAYIRDLDDAALTSQVLTMSALVTLMFGSVVDEDDMVRALELEDRDAEVPILFRASVVDVIVRSWAGHIEEARAGSLDMRRYCLERGAESDLMVIASHRSMIEIWRGDFGEAAENAREAMVHAELAGTDHLRAAALVLRATADTYLGRTVEARAQAAEALEGALRCGSTQHASWAMMVQVFIEVTLGNHAAALGILARANEMSSEGRSGGIMTALYLPDAIEALIGLGQFDEADPLIATLEASGRDLDRAFVSAAGARCRAMWFAARGEVPQAIAAARDAMREHDRVPMPFERARTLLVLGQLYRRQRATTGAAQALTEAAAEFDRMGTPIWAARARAELRGVRQPVATTGLTPSERRVAELAVDGMSNRDLARALSVSLKTVEANLTQIYRKLGIRSRAQIAQALRPAGD